MSSALRDLPPFGDRLHLADREAEAGPGRRLDPAGWNELHVRRLVYQAGHWHFKCSCGYVSLGFVSEHKAETWPCPVEQLLVESRIRLRRLHQSA